MTKRNSFRSWYRFTKFGKVGWKTKNEHWWSLGSKRWTQYGALHWEETLLCISKGIGNMWRKYDKVMKEHEEKRDDAEE